MVKRSLVFAEVTRYTIHVFVQREKDLFCNHAHPGTSNLSFNYTTVHVDTTFSVSYEIKRAPFMSTLSIADAIMITIHMYTVLPSFRLYPNTPDYATWNFYMCIIHVHLLNGSAESSDI